MLQSSSSVTSTRAPVLENLEPRRLFAGGVIAAARAQLSRDDTVGAVLASVSAATPAALAPSVTAARLSAGSPDDAYLDAFIAADLMLPNVGHGIDPATLTNENVKVYRRSAGPTRPIPANLDTSGGGDAIVLQPTGSLTRFATYTFEVTSGLKDTSGASFAPFKFNFKTGNRTDVSSTTGSFSKTALPTTANQMWTALTFGPDGKLYGGTLDGAIYRFTLDATGGLGAGELIDTIRTNNAGNRLIGGIEFDPASTAGDLILWVSHSFSTLEEATDWTGKVSRLSGANLETYEDKVTGLPRSIRDHVTNQIKFGPDGALYVLQGSMTAMGAGDNAWGFREEHALSAAMLRVDTKSIGAAVNVQTGDGGTYDPNAPGAPVTVYASGIRNAWDMVWHRNGKLYVPTNGSAAGGNTPAGDGGHALTNVRDTQHDFLFDVVKGGYYGHPNPSRGEYVFNGGNPTSVRDPYEFRAYPVGTMPEPHYRGAAFDFGTNYSPNGVIEYKATSFGGTFDGKLMVVRYSGADDILVLEPDANGNIVSTQRGVPGLTGFNDPLDLIQDPNTGNVYVAEFGGQKITLLKPTAQLGFDKELVVFNDTNGGGGSATQYITFNNRSKKSITIPADGFSLAGRFAALYRITERPLDAVTLAPDATVRIGLSFAAPASISAGIKWALLRVKTTDATRPPMDLPLRGIATPGSGAGEPSLQRILDAYQIGVRVGDTNPGDPVLTAPPASPNDEVAAQKFYKADVKEYVSIQPLAFFGAGSRKDAARFGWYDIADRGFDTQLFSVASNSIQSVNPNYNDGAMFRFDPGDVGFGFYTQFPAFGNRGVYTEHKYNTWETNTSKRQKTRFYTFKTSEGVAVPNTYIMAVEDTTGAPDLQDAVFIIRNVRLTPPTTGGTLPAGPFGLRGLNLINADTDTAIGRLGNGTVLDLSDGPFSIEAIVTGAVGSVRFKIDGLQFNTEDFGRFTIAGETGIDINPWVPTVGTHTLEARTYSGPNGTGSAGGFKRVTFTVVA